ncbi:unannotated protein [freshwater metagenome]|uniref:Unannotated protein n=1 Tax=freshwater metagenome TaxID=449393 RepID=A0A6J5ZU53_9ZZZZ
MARRQRLAFGHLKLNRSGRHLGVDVLGATGEQRATDGNDVLRSKLFGQRKELGAALGVEDDLEDA